MYECVCLIITLKHLYSNFNVLKKEILVNKVEITKS